MSVILAVVSDAERRGALGDALERRYGADYDVVSVAATDLVATEVGPVAVGLAPIGTEDFAALQTVCAEHPSARRIAVVEVGDRSVADELGRALTLNRVDYYVGQPWATPEEELYPVVGEALRSWTQAKQLRLDKVTVVDSTASGRGEHLVSWLNRNTVGARLHLADSPEGAELLAGPLAGAELPAALLWDGRLLADPADDELAEALGGNTRPNLDHYDLAVVGAGPAGLAAALYGASEGLHVCLVEGFALGGQAGTSAKIRNYLGFRWGIGGGDLVFEAARQAEQLGAEVVVTRQATALAAEGDVRIVSLANGDVVRSRAAVLAGGVTYRRLDVPTVDALVGRGVFYGAGAAEAATTGGLRAFVLGGGNSAGQAAAHMAAAGADVTVLIRGDSLARSMSDYLVEQLTGTPNVRVRTGVQVTGAVGETRLSGLVLSDTTTGDATEVPADALFVFIGASPRTDWIEGTVETDERGFVLTGRDGAAWLETNVERVYAAGDIRAGSVKRVAAAVGEGSTAAILALEALRPA